eukprot:gene16996-biopygen17167
MISAVYVTVNIELKSIGSPAWLTESPLNTISVTSSDVIPWNTPRSKHIANVSPVNASPLCAALYNSGDSMSRSLGAQRSKTYRNGAGSVKAPFHAVSSSEFQYDTPLNVANQLKMIWMNASSIDL